MLARLLINFTVQHVDSGPMTDVSSQAVRCYEASDSVAANTSVATVAAGSTVGFKVRQLVMMKSSSWLIEVCSLTGRQHDGPPWLLLSILEQG